MPWAAAAAAVGTIGAAAVSSSMAPGTSGGSGGGGPNYYIPTGLQSADQQWQNLQNQNYNIYNQAGLQQYGEQSLDAQLANAQAYAPQLMQGANQASAQYGNLGQQLQGAAGLNFGAQQGLLNAGQQTYQTALDPQSALYNRSIQQLQDQTGATNSMYGLGNSAAGAGVANQALGNFNIDWQNQQLQRQLSGLQGYGQAAGQAGQLAGQGSALGAAGAGYTLQGSQIPYQSAQQLAGAPGQFGGQYGQYLQSNVYGPAQGIQNQFIPYANYGQGAQSVPYQNQLQGAGTAGALLSQGINQIGNNPQVQQGLQGLFGGGNTYGAQNSLGFGGGDLTSPYYSGGGANSGYGFTM